MRSFIIFLGCFCAFLRRLYIVYCALYNMQCSIYDRFMFPMAGQNTQFLLTSDTEPSEVFYFCFRGLLRIFLMAESDVSSSPSGTLVVSIVHRGTLI